MKRQLAALFIVAAALPAAADESPLCETNRALIETSLKVIARETGTILMEEVDAVGGRPANHSVKTIYITGAWAQISVSLQHMQALGCKPATEPLDPAYYTSAANACERDRSRERKACKLKDWQRVTPVYN